MEGVDPCDDGKQQLVRHPCRRSNDHGRSVLASPNQFGSKLVSKPRTTTFTGDSRVSATSQDTRSFIHSGRGIFCCRGALLLAINSAGTRRDGICTPAFPTDCTVVAGLA